LIKKQKGEKEYMCEKENKIEKLNKEYFDEIWDFMKYLKM
jgi:hypothetical protein